MHTLKLLGRGLLDAFGQLLPFTLLSLTWWVCVLLIVPGPAATVTLFTMTDPRRMATRPDWREVIATGVASFRRGWGIAFWIMPPVIILLLNLRYYGGDASHLAWLLPIWASGLVLTLAVGLWGSAVVALTAAQASTGLRIALGLIARRPLQTLIVVVVLWLLVVVGTVLIVPVFVFVPAVVAAIVNRVVLDGLGLPVPDALSPTEERLREERLRGSGGERG